MAGRRLSLAVAAFCLLRQTNCQLPSRLTISPNPLELTPAQASGDGAPVTVQCQPPVSNTEFIYSMEIYRTKPGSAKTLLVTTDPTILLPDNWTFTARLLVTSPGFSASGGRKNNSIMLTMANAKCNDSAEYECEVNAANSKTYVKASNLTVDVKPSNITLTARPLQNDWLVNDTLTITCNGIVGSVKDKSQIEWVWQYRKRLDCPSAFAVWKKYTDYYSADDIVTEELRDDVCYKHQTSKLVRRLQLEDTNREFRCYVIRRNVGYEQFAQTAFVGTVSDKVPAVLSDCEVMMTTQRTLAGTCNFNKAYSSNDNYTCTWTLTVLDSQGGPHVTFSGVIRKTPYTVSGKVYHNGTCSVTSSWLPPGKYSYTVRFFPGDSNSQYQGTVTVTAADQSSSPDAYIAGGVVAAVVVIIAVVVVIVLVRRYLGRRLYDRPRRRRRQQPEENPYTGLSVQETVGQTAPSTSHVQATAQSVYEIPDQESAPSVELSQTNTAFTPDTGNGHVTYENGSTPGSSHPYKNDYQPAISSHTYMNNHQPHISSQLDGNNYQPSVSRQPYKNDNPADSSQPYEIA